MSANSSIFGTFAWTHPITLKLYKNKEDINLNKNHKKIPIFFGYFTKMAIRNLKNCENLSFYRVKYAFDKLSKKQRFQKNTISFCIYCLYLFGGGLIFMLLEGPKEQTVCQDMRQALFTNFENFNSVKF